MVTFSIMFAVAIGMTRWLNLKLQLALYCEFNFLCRADASHCCKILTTKRVGWMMQKQPRQSSSCYLQFNNTSWWSLNCTRFHLQDSCTSAAGLLLNTTRFLQKTVQDSPSSPAPSLHPAATVSQVAKATHNLWAVLRLIHALPHTGYTNGGLMSHKLSREWKHRWFVTLGFHPALSNITFRKTIVYQFTSSQTYASSMPKILCATHFDTVSLKTNYRLQDSWTSAARLL